MPDRSAISRPIARRARGRRPSRVPMRLTLGLLAAILALFWAGGWYILNVTRASKELDLGLRMKLAGEVAVDGLQRAFAPELLRASFIPPPGQNEGLFMTETRQFLKGETDYESDAQRLKQFVTDIAALTGLRRVMLVDVYERVIADSQSQNEALPFEVFPYLAIDRPEMATALENDSTEVTPFYQVSEQPYKRSYTPITAGGAEPFAFLRLEASRDYFAEMTDMRRHLLFFLLAVTVLISVVALIFLRLLHYLFRAEEAMADADRLSSVATLAAGFAHEVRNPLGIIRSCAEGLAEELDSKEAEAREIAQDMIEEVVRLNGLVTQFLEFARPPRQTEWGPVDVTESLRSVLVLARKQLESKQLALELDLPDSAPPVRADEKTLKQVFLNVLLNAIEASEPGGTIRLSLRVRRGTLQVLVEDTGRGIPPADLKHVFDPFFTTKKGGTGLGLSISRSIVGQFGGGIEIESEPGQGARVEIVLPVF